MGLFLVDQGATYRLDEREDDGVLVATGLNTGTVYASAATSLAVTGRRRYQNGRQGVGERAVLLLDTGEGVSRLTGVLQR